MSEIESLSGRLQPQNASAEQTRHTELVIDSLKSLKFLVEWIFTLQSLYSPKRNRRRTKEDERTYELRDYLGTYRGCCT